MFQEPSMYRDREAAGRAIARHILAETEYHKMDPIVVAVPKNAICVAKVVAEELECELDVSLIQRIPSLMDPEKTLAAVTETGEVVFDDDTCAGMFQNYITEQRLAKLKQLRDTRGVYSRHIHSMARFSSRSLYRGRTVILVDDGIMTGTTMRAAIQFVRAMYKPARIVVAVPICSQAALTKLREVADDCIILYSPKRNFHNLAEFYVNSPVITDLDVISALQESAEYVKEPHLRNRRSSSNSEYSTVSHPVLFESDDENVADPADTCRREESVLWTGQRRYGRSLSILSASDSIPLSRPFDD